MRGWLLPISLVMASNFPLLALSTPRIPPLDTGLASIFGGKKHVQRIPSGWMLHKQSVTVETVDLKPAAKSCENWSWVAGISDMAAAQGVQIDQQYMVDRLYGGSVCLPSAGDPSDLAQRISHDYVLPDGQKFQFAAQFTPGAPAQADPLILALRQSRPPMLFWRNRGYLLTGIDYDEYVAPTGNKIFIVTELKLFDPAAEEGKRDLTFSRERDDPADINGIFDLSVYSK
jgi:hypothetical protein